MSYSKKEFQQMSDFIEELKKLLVKSHVAAPAKIRIIYELLEKYDLSDRFWDSSHRGGF